ncbi:hypothetical protein N9067_04160 [Akkermansiaceae bacterium]|nr:hypothetical protein [Akkermansiaceae bacterium]
MSDKNENDTLISCPFCNGTIDIQFFSTAQEFECPHCSGLLASPEASTTNEQPWLPDQLQQTSFQPQTIRQGKNVFWMWCGLSVLCIAVVLTVVWKIATGSVASADKEELAELRDENAELKGKMANWKRR